MPSNRFGDSNLDWLNPTKMDESISKLSKHIRDSLSGVQKSVFELNEKLKKLKSEQAKGTKGLKSPGEFLSDEIQGVASRSKDKSTSFSKLKSDKDRLKDIQGLAQAFLGPKDQQNISKQIDLVAKSLVSEINHRKQTYFKIGDFLKRNSIDALSITAALTTRNPIIGLGIKYLLERRKASKEMDAANKQSNVDMKLGLLDNLRKNREALNKKRKLVPLPPEPKKRRTKSNSEDPELKINSDGTVDAEWEDLNKPNKGEPIRDPNAPKKPGVPPKSEEPRMMGAAGPVNTGPPGGGLSGHGIGGLTEGDIITPEAPRLLLGPGKFRNRNEKGRFAPGFVEGNYIPKQEGVTPGSAKAVDDIPRMMSHEDLFMKKVLADNEKLFGKEKDEEEPTLKDIDKNLILLPKREKEKTDEQLAEEKEQRDKHPETSNKTEGTKLLGPGKAEGKGILSILSEIFVARTGLGIIKSSIGRISGVLTSPIAMVGGSILLLAVDAIMGVFKAKAWGTSKISAGLGGMLGGSLKSQMLNSFTQMGKWALIGATAGSFIPVLGTLAGGLLGAAIGGILGYIGGENLSKGMDKIGEKIKDLFKNLYICILEFVATALEYIPDNVPGSTAVHNAAARIRKEIADLNKDTSKPTTTETPYKDSKPGETPNTKKTSSPNSDTTVPKTEVWTAPNSTFKSTITTPFTVDPVIKGGQGHPPIVRSTGQDTPTEKIQPIVPENPTTNEPYQKPEIVYPWLLQKKLQIKSAAYHSDTPQLHHKVKNVLDDFEPTGSSKLDSFMKAIAKVEQNYYTNPGNLKVNGQLATYPSRAEGWNQLAKQILNGKKAGLQNPKNLNLYDFFGLYAPYGEGSNDPVAYAERVGNLTGFDPNKSLRNQLGIGSKLPSLPQTQTAQLGRPVPPQQGQAILAVSKNTEDLKAQMSSNSGNGSTIIAPSSNTSINNNNIVSMTHDPRNLDNSYRDFMYRDSMVS
jgi:hypothetical protein